MGSPEPSRPEREDGVDASERPARRPASESDAGEVLERRVQLPRKCDGGGIGRAGSARIEAARAGPLTKAAGIHVAAVHEVEPLPDRHDLIVGKGVAASRVSPVP